jgi:ABC-type dipeptide/oligopeptide/nickel transport system permease subunit
VGPAADHAVLRHLHWTPVSGRIDLMYFFKPVTGFMLIDSLISGPEGAFKSAFASLILPTIVLGTIPLAVIARQTRSAMLEVLGEDYVRTARSKGLAPLRVVGIHALRNALIPVVTSIGLQVGVLIGGAILTETIFSWPGIGKWMVDAIVQARLYRRPGRPAADRADRHARQFDRRSALRRLINPRIRALGAANEHDKYRTVAAQPSGLSEFWYYFSVNKGAVIGLVVFVFVLLLAIFAPFVAPHDPNIQSGIFSDCRRHGQEGGNSAFLLGTDAVGRDMLSRLIYGTRFSLFIGLVVASLSPSPACCSA